MNQKSQTPKIEKLAALLKPWDLRDSCRDCMDLEWKLVKRRLGKNSERCIICGARGICKSHVRPQQDGFGPEDNLVPLCDRGDISPLVESALEEWWEREPNKESRTAWNKWHEQKFERYIKNKKRSIGCHKLFDDGFISVETIAACAKKPHSFHPHVRAKALEVKMKYLDTKFGAAKTRKLRLKNLRKKIKNFQKGSDEWCKTYCELISIARRLPSYVWMEAALKAIPKISRHIMNSNIKKKTRSQFYYEVALTWMQRHPDSDIEKAISCLEKSITIAGNKKESVAKSEIELVQAKMLAASSKTARQAKCWKHWLNRLDKAFRMIKGRNKRWDINQRFHKVQILLKAWQKPRAIFKEIKNMREALYKLTLSNGWSLFYFEHLAAIEGMAYAQASQFEQSVYALARATRLMLGDCRGKRPEGYKDVAASAGWVLAQMKCQGKRARKVLNLAKSMKDGCSGVWPIDMRA